MKVLQVINSLATGGAEKLILETVPLFNSNGIKCDVLVLKDQGNPFYKELESKNICAIHNLNLSSIYNPLGIFKMIPIFKQYDVVHVHIFPAQYHAALAKLLLKILGKNVQLIFTEHSTTNNRISNKKYHLIDKNIYKIYDKTVCISNEIHNLMSNYTGLSKEKFPIVENGVAINKVKNALPIKKENIHSSLNHLDRLILQVSSFSEAKDQPTLIKSLKYLPKQFKLIFAGDGIRIQESKELAKKENVEDRVLFLGVRTDIPQLLKSVDYVVLSSKFEGLSLASVEGMASGNPFIATDVPGLRDVVKNAGILFPYQDEKKFADIILDLEDNPKKRQKVIKKCQDRAEKYDIDSMVNKLINLYTELTISES